MSLRSGATLHRLTILWAVSLFLLTTGLSQAKGRARRYENHQIVRLTIRTQAELDAVEASGANILNCVHGVGPVDALVSPSQRAALAQRGIPMETIRRDVQRWVDLQRSAADPAVAGGDPFDDFFLSYHPYGDVATVGSIVWYTNELATRYPALATMVDVGTTIEGRTIKGLRITNDSITEKPGVLYFSAEHAREWITPTVPLFFATHLLENYGADAMVADLVDNVEFFLIPVMNVDGYIYTWTTERFWRKNRRHNGGSSYGVDLNRNWAEGWGGPGSSGSTTSNTYRGPSPFSEPETQAMRDFFLAHPNIRATLDIHSYTQLILWPYGYTSALPVDQDVYSEVGLAMRSLIFDVHGKIYTAGPVYTTIYPASGVSSDWTYAELGILSFAYECRDDGFYGFTLPADQIIPQGEELLPALLHLADSDWVRLTAPAPVAAVAGSRYLSITPPTGFSEVSLRVTSPDHPCLDKFVTVDGYLSSTPTVQSSASWGTVYVGDVEVLPESTYIVAGNYGFGWSAVPAVVTTGTLADVAGTTGVVNFSDISAVVDHFRDAPGAPPLEACDVSPLVPDRAVDFDDIAVTVDMFRGYASPYASPCP